MSESIQISMAVSLSERTSSFALAIASCAGTAPKLDWASAFPVPNVAARTASLSKFFIPAPKRISTRCPILEAKRGRTPITRANFPATLTLPREPRDAPSQQKPCTYFRFVPVADVVRGLRARGLGDERTTVAGVAEHAKERCPACSAMSWASSAYVVDEQSLDWKVKGEAAWEMKAWRPGLRPLPDEPPDVGA